MYMYTLYTVYYCNVRNTYNTISNKIKILKWLLNHILLKNEKKSTPNATNTKQCYKNVLSNVWRTSVYNKHQTWYYICLFDFIIFLLHIPLKPLTGIRYVSIRLLLEYQYIYQVSTTIIPKSRILKYMST